MRAFKGAVTLILAIFVVIVSVAFTGSDLWRDLRLSREPLTPASGVRLEKAECTTHWMVITNCTVNYLRVSQTKSTSLHYIFLGGTPQERVQLMAAPGDRNTIVTDVGIAKLNNRIAALAVWLAGFAALGWFGVRVMRTA